MSFASLEEARVALLCDAVSLASRAGEQFAVIGGWSPFLLNSAPIKHPGTADVDLLFSEGVTPGRLRMVYELFLAEGYYPSAKHPFQLLQVIQVGSEKLAFNIDFLHPNEQGQRDLFADHIELPVPLTPFIRRQLKMKSIAVPASKFIFKYQQLDPPLTIDAGKHQRFKVRLTSSGYAWTGYIRLTLLYGRKSELPLPWTFLAA